MSVWAMKAWGMALTKPRSTRTLSATSATTIPMEAVRMTRRSTAGTDDREERSSAGRAAGAAAAAGAWVTIFSTTFSTTLSTSTIVSAGTSLITSTVTTFSTTTFSTMTSPCRLGSRRLAAGGDKQRG